MKRSVFIIVVLLLLILGTWGGATYWFGAKTEQQYLAILNQASQSPYLKFTNESYSRGFLGSNVRTTMRISLPKTDDVDLQELKLTLAHDITHGPFPLGKSPDGTWSFRPLMAVIQTRIMFDPETQSRLDELYGKIPEIGSTQDYTLIYLDGTGKEHLSVPGFKHAFGDQDKVAIDWSGLSVKVDFSSDLKKVTGSLNVPGLSVSTKELDLKVTQVKTGVDTYEGIAGLSLGTSSLNVATIQAMEKKEANSSSFLMDGIMVGTSATASGDTVRLSVASRVDRLKIDEALYGPAVFELELRNLDADTLARAQRVFQNLQTQPSQQSADEIREMMLGKLVESLAGLLKKSPELEISQLSIKTADGDFTGKIKVGIDGTKGASLENPATLANAVTAQAELKAGERLLHRILSSIAKSQMSSVADDEEEDRPSEDEINAAVSVGTDEQLEGLLQQNILVKENGNYMVTASFGEGRIVLNGVPLPLEGLFQQ